MDTDTEEFLSVLLDAEFSSEGMHEDILRVMSKKALRLSKITPTCNRPAPEMLERIEIPIEGSSRPPNGMWKMLELGRQDCFMSCQNKGLRDNLRHDVIAGEYLSLISYLLAYASTKLERYETEVHSLRLATLGVLQGYSIESMHSLGLFGVETSSILENVAQICHHDTRQHLEAEAYTESEAESNQLHLIGVSLSLAEKKLQDSADVLNVLKKITIG